MNFLRFENECCFEIYFGATKMNEINTFCNYQKYFFFQFSDCVSLWVWELWMRLVVLHEDLWGTVIQQQWQRFYRPLSHSLIRTKFNEEISTEESVAPLVTAKLTDDAYAHKYGFSMILLAIQNTLCGMIVRTQKKIRRIDWSSRRRTETELFEYKQRYDIDC